MLKAILALLAAASTGFAAALALLAGCGGDQPLPPDEALAECIRAGAVAHWRASRESSEFSCVHLHSGVARMILTEDDATKKRCTPAIVLLLLDRERRDALQAGGAEAHTQCIGSKCMQWIWYDHTRDGARTYGGDQFRPGRAEPVDGARNPRAPRGYCGLVSASRE